MSMMIKRLLYALSISILFFSCAKEYSYEGGFVKTNPYYITANINGTDREFNFDAVGAYTMASGLPVLELTAFINDDDTDLTSITLDIYYDPNTTPSPGVGTYDDQTDDYFVTGFYDYNDPDFLYAAGTSDFPPSIQPLSITITFINSEVVEGTFSGAFYRADKDDNGNVYSDFVTINNGKFRLQLQ